MMAVAMLFLAAVDLTSATLIVFGAMWTAVQIGDRLWKRNGRNGKALANDAEVRRLMVELISLHKSHLEIAKLRHDETTRQLDRIEQKGDRAA